MITFKVDKKWKKTDMLFQKLLTIAKSSSFDEYGERGVEALRSATPISSGKTASSWYYTIEKTETGVTISWCNSNVHENVNIAVIIQYGHGTGTGGYVQGIDYINPSIKPIFEQIANDVWKEVSK